MGLDPLAVTTRNGEEDQAGSDKDEAGENEEGAAPAQLAHEILSGLGRHDDAQGAHGHDAGIGERAALGRHPERGRLEARHQAAGKAQPDNGPGEKQGEKAGRQREQSAARGGERQQGGLDAAWTKAVEQYAERQLEQGEGQEIGRGQQPKLGRGQQKIGDEIRRHNRIHGPQQVGQQIAESEGGEARGDDAKRNARRHVREMPVGMMPRPDGQPGAGSARPALVIAAFCRMNRVSVQTRGTPSLALKTA